MKRSLKSRTCQRLSLRNARLLKTRQLITFFVLATRSKRKSRVLTHKLAHELVDIINWTINASPHICKLTSLHWFNNQLLITQKLKKKRNSSTTLIIAIGAGENKILLCDHLTRALTMASCAHLNWLLKILESKYTHSVSRFKDYYYC